MPIYLATLAAGQARANTASMVLGIVVVTFSFVLGGAELAGIDLDRFALAIGVSLFVTVLAIRMAPEGLPYHGSHHFKAPGNCQQ